ncbi:hypothetical protein KH172YL63_05510 [Bacillus sp. KH172YL63]|nr:hypothetical protein KH172YL63_05510 [Bacillus sp. KH172YL63]
MIRCREYPDDFTKALILSPQDLQTLPIFAIIKPYFFGSIPFTKGCDGLYNPVVQLFTENQKT